MGGTGLAPWAFMSREAVHPPAVRVNPKLRSHTDGVSSPPRVRLLIVGDWEAVCSPGIKGLCGLLRKRLIAGERVLVLHGRLAAATEDPDPVLPALRLPTDADLLSADRLGESVLRLSLVRDLVGEGLPAFALSGVDLGLLRRGDDGVLKIDASRLAWLLSSGVLPVIGVDCLRPDGTVGRTTVSEVTQTLAQDRDIHSVDVVTNSDRVLQPDGSEALALQLGDLTRRRARGPNHFPSAPVTQSVLESTLAALENGVPTARIGSVASLVNRTATEVTQAGRGVVVR
jgi:hypothetical protein